MPDDMPDDLMVSGGLGCFFFIGAALSLVAIAAAFLIGWLL